LSSPYQLYLQQWRQGCGSELCTRARKVHCRGKLPCDVLFVGEAPGESENVVGQPFAGPAGHLMDLMIKRGLPSTARTALTNLVGCIPKYPEQGTGKAEEPDAKDIEQCAPRLQDILNMAKPKLLVCVGKLAWSWLRPGFKNEVQVPKEVRVIEITHPAHILRANISQKALMVQRNEVILRTAWSELT
jgi:uracil-DNA glycosylase family 4